MVIQVMVGKEIIQDKCQVPRQELSIKTHPVYYHKEEIIKSLISIPRLMELEEIQIDLLLMRFIMFI